MIDTIARILAGLNWATLMEDGVTAYQSQTTEAAVRLVNNFLNQVTRQLEVASFGHTRLNVYIEPPLRPVPLAPQEELLGEDFVNELQLSVPEEKYHFTSEGGFVKEE